MTVTTQTPARPVGSPAVSGWARLAVWAATIANILVLGFVSLPVVGFFVITFNGFAPGSPTTIGVKAIWTLVILAFALLPMASIYFSWRLLGRQKTGPAIAAGAIVPIIGALLYATYGVTPPPPPPPGPTGTLLERTPAGAALMAGLRETHWTNGREAALNMNSISGLKDKNANA